MWLDVTTGGGAFIYEELLGPIILYSIGTRLIHSFVSPIKVVSKTQRDDSTTSTRSLPYEQSYGTVYDAREVRSVRAEACVWVCFSARLQLPYGTVRTGIF